MFLKYTFPSNLNQLAASSCFGLMVFTGRGSKILFYEGIWFKAEHGMTNLFSCGGGRAPLCWGDALGWGRALCQQAPSARLSFLTVTPFPPRRKSKYMYKKKSQSSTVITLNYTVTWFRTTT